MTSFTNAIPRPLSSSMSPGPGEFRGSQSPAPAMMKPSFSQISEPISGTGSSMSGQAERTKVAFGFGTKRRAEENGIDTPPAKRR